MDKVVGKLWISCERTGSMCKNCGIAPVGWCYFAPVGNFELPFIYAGKKSYYTYSHPLIILI